ncbi:MAG: RIP metalloprotease RseP [Sterolibacterium sp.]|nr:RIP metalloprotease RseP [Sterolibacterium sp.]
MTGHLPFYLLAFAVALGVLIVVHEFGHYLVARWCGVKVLRFSVGFGKVLWLRRFGADGTEWALAAFPLGGFVRMLDEREAPVAAHELSRAFNRQSVWRRILIVAAGPIANLLLAIVLYWFLFMHGSEELRPLLAAPPAATAAAAAGIEAGETVLSVNGRPVVTWQNLRWELTRVALDHVPIKLELRNQRQEINLRLLATENVKEDDLAGDLPGQLGLRLYRPLLPAVVGQVVAGSAAEQAGLRADDRILGIDAQPVTGWQEVVSRVHASAGVVLDFVVQRGDELLTLPVTPARVHEQGQTLGRIGVVVKEDARQHSELFVTVHYGALAALGKAVRQTWDMASFSLRMMGRMLTGDLSWKNLSGPVTIADYAGQSARMGIVPYLNFLALISISLGVLNLLPIPVLDGGHLLYYVAEIIKGGPLSERVMEIGQQIGLALLMMLMAFAFYNDINRLISG